MTGSHVFALSVSIGAAASSCAAPAQPDARKPPFGPTVPTARADVRLDAAVPPASREPASSDAAGEPGNVPDAAGDLGHNTPDASLAASVPPLTPSACSEQAPQSFLVRGNFLKVSNGNERAIQYRTDRYGYFRGFGRAENATLPPTAFVIDTTFFGLKVRMHQKVVPALACVEEEIRRRCVDHPYTPHALAGIRTRNTYRGGEVTNHAYGIAIDIDPSLNTCCGCVPPWNDAPACKRATTSEYGHMAMPECWVHVFERFGFYWLGHDVLKDTMHFEFLGDPERIAKAGGVMAPLPPPPDEVVPRKIR